jgi:hypothetical protein
MFENAQQEPSGGSGKTIGIVVVVAVVILAALYFGYFSGQPASTPQTKPTAAAGGGGKPAPDADFKKDLVVERPNLGRDQTQTMAVWSFQIVNRSRTYGYRNLKYSTTYYDGAGNVIHNGSGDISDEVAPGDQRTISDINDGLYPLNTQRFTIEISSAEGFTP